MPLNDAGAFGSQHGIYNALQRTLSLAASFAAASGPSEPAG